MTAEYRIAAFIYTLLLVVGLCLAFGSLLIMSESGRSGGSNLAVFITTVLHVVLVWLFIRFTRNNAAQRICGIINIVAASGCLVWLTVTFYLARMFATGMLLVYLVFALTVAALIYTTIKILAEPKNQT
jgi:hypothetical protein